MNQGHNKGRDDGEDENRQLLLQLFDNFGEDRDPLNRRANALHDAIVEFNGGHDRPENILDIHGEFFGILWRDWLVFFLGGGCVRLDLVEFVSLIASRKNTRGELAEESLKEAGISHLAFVKCSLKLVDLVLSQLIGYWKALVMMISNYGENLKSAPTFSSYRVEEIHASECTSYDRINRMAGTLQLNLSVAADMGKDSTLAHFNKRKLSVVAVSEEIYLFATILAIGFFLLGVKRGKLARVARRLCIDHALLCHINEAVLLIMAYSHLLDSEDRFPSTEALHRALACFPSACIREPARYSGRTEVARVWQRS